MDSDRSARPATGWSSWLRRPAGLVARTRWLFCLLVLVSLALALSRIALAGEAPAPALLAATGVLALLWVVRYVSGRALLVLDLAEVAAVAAVAANGADVAAAYSFVFASLWFRALFGSTPRIMLFCVFEAASVLAVLAPDGAAPPSGNPALAMDLPPVVSMVVTTAVARYLALGLFAREEAQRRDAALVALGQQLIGLTDRSGIERRARECSAAICAATPGLTALLVHGTPDGPTVLDHTGTPDYVRARLPRSVAPDPGGADAAGTRAVTHPEGLAALPGTRCAWVSVALPDQADVWILLGAPRRVPDEAVVAVRSMANLVALALRTSDAHQDLTVQATHDALTGLANRPAFTAALERALADRAGCVTLLAARLRWAVRPDDLCARLGGDEFAVLLLDTDDGAPGVAQRLVELIASPVSLKGRLATVGASVGLAFAGRGTTAAELVQQADVAMYAAKAKGKNRVQAFDPSLLRDRDEAGFEAEVAAAARAGQLVVHYQPIMSVADDRCVAVEALVRWRHPHRGLVGPAEFIGIAERTGAIAGIGAFVLRQACADAAGWAGPSGPLAVHVNVSAAQLTDPEFIDLVRDCLAEHAMAPETLVLEITEGMVLDSAPVRRALDRLDALGVRIAVDDFGTGYSALSILRTLPLDIVKLDKSFLSHGPSHAADEAVVTAIVQMAGRLGLRVVAEGVERPDQQRFLWCVGIDAAQGHLHLRPTPADSFGRWLAGRSTDTRRIGTLTPVGRLIS